MQNNLIKVEIADHIALVKMDAPPVNAQTRAFVEELTEVFDILHDMPEARVVILTGREKIFSAGADIKSRAAVGGAPGDNYKHMRRTRELSNSIIECSKPVIAAVNGPALGAGLGPVIASDIILASENAVFGLPEIDIGLMGGARHAMKLFPHSLARRMILTGYRLPAAGSLSSRHHRMLRAARATDGRGDGDGAQHCRQESQRRCVSPSAQSRRSSTCRCARAIVSSRT